MWDSNTGELITHILKDQFIHNNVQTGTDLMLSSEKEDIIQTAYKSVCKKHLQNRKQNGEELKENMK